MIGTLAKTRIVTIELLPFTARTLFSKKARGVTGDGPITGTSVALTNVDVP